MPYEQEIPPYGDLVQPPEEVNQLARTVIGICIDVHRALGPALPEEAYQRALAIELTERGIPFRAQHRLVVQYRGQPVATVRLDFLIDEKLVLEVKSVETLTPIDRRQVTRYLQITKLSLGLLVNFNVMALKDGVHRIFRAIPDT